MKVVTLPVYNFLFRIPPGDANHEVVGNYACKKDCHIVGPARAITKGFVKVRVNGRPANVR